MLIGLSLLILLCSAAFCLRQHRREAAWRGELLDACAGQLAAPRLGRDRAGFATLRGRLGQAAVDVRLVPDTLVHRRLPQLWLRVTLRMPLATEATLDVLRRPVGAEFYAPDRLPLRLPVPAAWPADTLVRGTAGAEALLGRVVPALGRILAEPRVKEVLVTPDGLRLTVQASQGERGTYLLLRGSRFALSRLAPEQLGGALRAGLELAEILSEPSSETRHARAA
ncbi:hypothetical protein MPPM_0234 [Methylorubrum populi]|uniref:Uncharacterized protein n=1 Tax=Methylorubrum populi TaxID=223967 RepID=A0A161JJW9_9HYPH|nr:hypothetical protein [Methylorubrum populi]BAU88839.1 hypothetical protein MPPM_0234 [Methylorubrum populi]